MKIISQLTLVLFTIVAVTTSVSSAANECKILPKVLSAYYDFNQQKTHNVEQQKKPLTAAKKTQLFELHRYNNRVLQRDLSQGVNDIWSHNGNRLSLNRAFEQYQHTIEYQSNELRYQPKWQDIFHLVAIPDLNKMQLVEQKNSGCQLEQHYIHKTKTSTYQLVWLPNLELVKFFELKSASLTRQWSLTNYQGTVEQITALFTQYSRFQSTDYADVGDNESTPFLAAMINQGFSASQNTQALHTHHEAH
ncbi:MAG TPA: hypothetical protein DEO86_04195 [Colwellia sp.]|nr:hypothetical protein [Colwellia sp.]